MSHPDGGQRGGGPHAGLQDPPDLILLDIGLPGMDCVAALRQFQARAVPVIFLTARHRDLDQVIGLELGADDYIGEPFNPDVLLARVKNALRHYQRRDAAPKARAILRAGDLTVDPATRTATANGGEVELLPRAFDLLHALAARAGQVVPINELLSQVWGAEYMGESQVVFVHIRWLRKKIENDSNQQRQLITVHGQGYKLVGQEPGEA